MTNRVRGLGLATTLVFVASLAVVPQAKAQSTAAYVYVQSTGPAGPVYGYAANTSGQLSAISGSPFKPGTQIVGGTGSQFFTLGKTLIHSYAVGSDGAIQSQLHQIAILDYAGSGCGGGSNGIDNAVLDHTGRYIYTLLYNGSGGCAAYQSYIINNDGSFTFDGDTEQQAKYGNDFSVPSILGNETFAYGDWMAYLSHSPVPIAFKRQSNGTLEVLPNFEYHLPALSNGYYSVFAPDSSPTSNNVVLQLYPNNSNPPQLGSFTPDPQGNLSTTNTSSNMPTSQLEGPYSTFSPDGKYLVLYANAQNGAGHVGNGIEIYNFNGAAPLTLNTRLLNGTPIDQVAWDSTHHLYAISHSENKLWVFDVEAASYAQTALVSIASPFSLVVVNKASGSSTCSPPTSNDISICSPSEGEMTNAPVKIDATAMVSGGVYRFEVWSGSTKLISSDTNTINQSISLAPGSYKLTFDAYNSTKSSHVYAYRDITVQ